MRILALAPLLLAVPAIAQAQERPDPARLKASVEKLVGFGTRHTLSDADHPSRGIGAARRWFAAELAKLGDQCDCIEVANIARGFTGPRAPNGVQIVDVLGFQAGSDPRRVVIVMGHIDSRVGDVMNTTADAPGANDDASGVALVLEAARILSREKFRATIVYAALSGEEQGLFGGQLLAETARERGWTVTAVLNNDIVGNTVGTDGRKVADRVRIFSESFGENDAPQALQGLRADGGEDDGPSRALAKAIGQVAGTLPGGLDAFLVRRPDRFGRGGDHSPFQKLGYPAVRFSVGIENYDAQHQDLAPGKGDTVDRMDFPYLAGVTALNVATIRRLAAAPAAPDKVTIGGALASDTSVKWAAVPGAAKYRVHWRRADARDWTNHLDVTGTEVSLKGVIVDDNFVGVSAIGADGAESLVAFGRR
ncbi:MULTISPECIES: M20/M25/M40 family metallo-hydrolase [unclassified Sphingomonas]|uniref:M20/M25/M40 family metallo-hydrolase n=1 Tax=Sphingomonas TaxID=13687 RepID=UPI00095A1ED1|nr:MULTISPECIES: M20/M25/M40 family metallo-hydrolase [unclassified Sphingomonas]MBN8811970.1 M20/M25/M40 family metallo-hydrolase [Sphingomonas sp.]OJY48379.1 MAG: peptidase M28 [Sphingomonas sp. 67-41]